MRKDEAHVFLSMEFESFDMEPTQGEVNRAQRGDRIKSIHASAAGGQGHRPSHVVEAAPARVPTLDPHDQTVPDCASASSSSPERLFSSVGLIKSDLRGSLLDTTLIDVRWAKRAP